MWKPEYAHVFFAKGRQLSYLDKFSCQYNTVQRRLEGDWLVLKWIIRGVRLPLICNYVFHSYSKRNIYGLYDKWF
jgi:hypothetical protein